MSPNIPGIVAKHFRECRQTFRGMSPITPGIVAKHSGEYLLTFWGMSPSILGNILRRSGECRQTFLGMSLNIPENVLKQSNEYFFAKVSPLYTFFTGNKETNKQKCPELSLTWFEISCFTNDFCRLGNSMQNTKINLSTGNDI